MYASSGVLSTYFEEPLVPLPRHMLEVFPITINNSKRLKIISNYTSSKTNVSTY